jgi:tetratricopeptide (TPR) repeat protein
MGDPGRSLEFAERALEEMPHDPQSLWLKGAALINLGRDSDAIPVLTEAVTRDSMHAEYYRTLARAAEQLDQLDLEVDCYRHVVWLDDEDGEAWFQLAASEARRGRFGAADTAMTMATQLDPLRPGLFFLQGWIAEGLGRPDEAIQDYRQHLDIHREDQTTRRRLVLILAQRKRYKEALDEAHALAAARPGDLEARELEAELSFEAGETAQGMQLLDQMSKDFPNSLDALSARVGVLARHGRGHVAVTEADRWLAAHPDDVRARLMAARARELAGDMPAAIDQLKLAVAAAPDSLAPRVLLAQAYDRAGRTREAEPVWEESQRRFPGMSSVSLDLALCREKLGDLHGAEAAVRDVLAREPENPVALNFLGYLFADHDKNLDEAVQLILKALALEPDNAAFIDSLGWAYFRMGKLPEARANLERAIHLSGGDPVIYEHLGDVYRDLQLKDLARDTYKKSLSYDKSNERVRAKLSSLR